VRDTQIGDEGLKALGNLHNLQVLNLDDTRVTNSGLRYLAPLPLKELWLPDAGVTNAGLKHLVCLPLEKLILPATITDDGLIEIGKISKLKHLSLYKTAISDNGLGHLSGLTKLENLDLSKTKVNGNGLKHLKNCSRIRTLGLVGTRTDDEGFRHVGNFKKLEYLNCSYSNVTAKIFPILRELENLKEVSLYGTVIAAEELDSFKKAMPAVKFYKE
jgi:Leucine-rich repeat (LRR) protein